MKELTHAIMEASVGMLYILLAFFLAGLVKVESIGFSVFFITTFICMIAGNYTAKRIMK